MSRRTLRGAIPTTDSIVASTELGDASAREALASATREAAASAPTRERGTESLVTPGPPVFRPAPGSREATARSGAESMPGPDAILLRGADAARARRVDLVGNPDPAELGAVGPWAEQLDDAREAARSSGFQQGRQEGLAAGLMAARHQVEENQEEAKGQLDRLGELLASTLDRIEVRSEELGQQLAGQVTDLALEIAKAVIDRELELADDPGAEALARCLDLVPATGTLTARLNPDDVDALGQVPGLGDRELVVTPDPSLTSGDAIVTVDHVTIDARLSESMRRVEEALR